jgi:hypothetical protein
VQHFVNLLWLAQCHDRGRLDALNGVWPEMAKALGVLRDNVEGATSASGGGTVGCSSAMPTPAQAVCRLSVERRLVV